MINQNLRLKSVNWEVAQLLVDALSSPLSEILQELLTISVPKELIEISDGFADCYILLLLI